MASAGTYVKDDTYEGYLFGPNDDRGPGVQTQEATPYITDDFYKNYRSVTRKLGENVEKPKGKIDQETYDIMNRIKLPDYHGVMTTEEDQAYWDLYNRDPDAAATKYDNDEMAFYQDNQNYKLRAAQYLKELPEEVREGYLNNFNISMTHAKKTLDDAIEADDKRKAKEAEQKLYNEFLDHLSTGDKLKYIIRGLSGEKDNVSNELRVAFDHYKNRDNDSSTVYKIETETGDNGVTSARLYSSTDPNVQNRGASLGDAIKFGIDTFKDKYMSNNSGETANEAPAEEPATTEDTTETIDYTYKPGDTFGQVIKDLGLESGNGLWGENGDVEYYTKQLEEQLWKSGVWPEGSRQNIPIGTTIHLKRRPMTQEMIDYRNQYGYN